MHSSVREILTPSARQQARDLLRGQGLDMPDPVDYGLAVYRGPRLIATGFREGSVLKGLCVDPSCQNEGVSASLISALLEQALDCGLNQLFVFTKPSGVPQFTGLGFSLVASVPGHAAFLEWGLSGFDDWLERIVPPAPEPGPIGAIVLNANPFTLGHRFLVETAARQCRLVYVFVVEADCAVFPFSARLRLVQQGTADLPGCRVLPGGAYIISPTTFPAYFSGAERHAANHAALDLHLFGQRIAPRLDIRFRFVGTEPVSAVTALYNRSMHSILPSYGVRVCECDRAMTEGKIISASTVRALLAQGDLDAALAFVPPTTAAYLQSAAAGPVLRHLRQQPASPEES